MIGPGYGSNWLSIQDVFPHGLDALQEGICGQVSGIVRELSPQLLWSLKDRQPDSGLDGQDG